MQSLAKSSSFFPSYRRRIKCPKHYLVLPGKDAFHMEVDPKFRFLSDADAKKFKISKYKKKKDKFGRPMINFKNMYQPEVTAGFAIENIYDPLNPICMKCKRCLEGQGQVHWRGIKRLNG